MGHGLRSMRILILLLTQISLIYLVEPPLSIWSQNKTLTNETKALIPSVVFRVFDLGEPIWRTDDPSKYNKIPSRFWMGIEVQSKEVNYKSKRVQGMLITSIFKGGPADQAGLKEGDYLLEIKSKKTSSFQSISFEKLKNFTEVLGRSDQPWLKVLRPHSNGHDEELIIQIKLERIKSQTQALMHAITSLDFHQAELSFPPQKQASALYSALFNDLGSAKTFACDSAGRNLALLTQSILSTPKHLKRKKRKSLKALIIEYTTDLELSLIQELKEGDIVIIHGYLRTLIAVFNGPSVCIKHSQVKSGYIRPKTFLKTFNFLDLPYRKKVIHQWNQTLHPLNPLNP